MGLEYWKTGIIFLAEGMFFFSLGSSKLTLWYWEFFL
jgi:hypothetical protein